MKINVSHDKIARVEFRVINASDWLLAKQG